MPPVPPGMVYGPRGQHAYRRDPGQDVRPSRPRISDVDAWWPGRSRPQAIADTPGAKAQQPLFPKGFRELSPIPDVAPPVAYHSLIVGNKGPGAYLSRYREFVLFHGEYVCPQYLIAYQRQWDSSLA